MVEVPTPSLRPAVGSEEDRCPFCGQRWQGNVDEFVLEGTRRYCPRCGAEVYLEEVQDVA